MAPAVQLSPQSARRLAPLLAALAAVGPFSIDAYLPAMNEIGQSLHASPLAVQQTLTAYMLPFAVMTLWHGSISDAIGRRRVILWGMAAYALASLGAATARSLETLLVFRALQGMTAGTGVVVGRAIVRDLFQGAEAQRVMSRVAMTFAIAPALAPVVGGWLASWWGWRSVFVFLVVFGAGAWLLARWVLPETLPRERRQSLRPAYLLRTYGRVLTSAPFMALSGSITLIFSGFFIYVTSAPVFLIRHLGVGETGFLWLFGPATAGMILGAAVSGRVAGRLTPLQTLRWAFVIMIVAAATNLGIHASMPPSLPLSVVPAVFFVFGMSMAFPSLTLLALDLFPEQRGLASSCQSCVQSLGAALNAVVAPWVWDSAFTLAVAQALALAGGAAGLLVYVRVIRTRSRPLELAAEVDEPATP